VPRRSRLAGSGVVAEPVVVVDSVPQGDWPVKPPHGVDWLVPVIGRRSREDLFLAL